MAALLDTNIVIDHFRKKGGELDNLLLFNEFCISTIVIGELLFGAQISLKREMNGQLVANFIKKVQVLEVDITVSEAYAAIKKYLKDKGKPIPENDIWIAATAHANQLKLITKDRHFENIDFLDVEFWD